MKKYILTFFALLLSTACHAEETARVYTDYSPVRVLYTISGQDPELEASKAGLSGSFKEVAKSSLPQDREHRDAWKFEKGKVVVDQKLKDSLENVESKMASAIEKIKSSSGLTDEELEALGFKERKR